MRTLSLVFICLSLVTLSACGKKPRVLQYPDPTLGRTLDDAQTKRSDPLSPANTLSNPQINPSGR